MLLIIICQSHSWVIQKAHNVNAVKLVHDYQCLFTFSPKFAIPVLYLLFDANFVVAIGPYSIQHMDTIVQAI